MKFGLAFASSIGTDPQSALEITRCAERVGFDSVWGGEHVIRPDTISSPYPYTEDGTMPGEAETPIPDPLIWLAYVAAAAPTLRLGTCILIVPQRNPLVLAKELATLDHLTGGRVELGARRVIRDFAAVVMVAVRDDRVAVIAAGPDQVEFIAMSRAHFDDPEATVQTLVNAERITVAY